MDTALPEDDERYSACGHPPAQPLPDVSINSLDAVLAKRGAAFAQEGVDQRKVNFGARSNRISGSPAISQRYWTNAARIRPRHAASLMSWNIMSPDYAATTLRAVTE